MNYKINSGLVSLLKNDAYLLEIDINERTLTHRLGMYYQALFPEWYVDCKYNKYHGKPKTIEIDVRKILTRMADFLENKSKRNGIELCNILANNNHYPEAVEELDNLQEQLRNPKLQYDAEKDIYIFLLHLLDGSTIQKTIIPDIIIHRREEEDNNLIVIEAKKTSNTNVASRVYDIVKLQTLITDKRYKYKRGYFLDLPVKDDFKKHKKFSFEHDAFEPKVTIVSSVS